MPQFHFKFAPLLKYRQNRRDQIQVALAQLMQQAADLSAQIDRLRTVRTEQLQQIRGNCVQGTVDVDAAASRRFFATQLEYRARATELERQQILERITACRQTLVHADQDVKVLERLEEKQRVLFVADAQRRSGHELEDVWSAGHCMEYRQ